MVLWLLPRETSFVKAANLAASLRQMLNHLRNPRLLAIYAVGFGVLFNFIAIFTFITFHLAAPPFSLSPFTLGLIFVVYLVGTVAALGTGRAIARLGRRRFVLMVLAVWAAGMLLTLLPSLLAIIAGLVIVSACGIITQASSTAFVTATAQGGNVRGGRALCHQLLRRRNVRRLASGAGLRGRRLAGLGRGRRRHARYHGADCRPGLARAQANRLNRPCAPKNETAPAPGAVHHCGRCRGYGQNQTGPTITQPRRCQLPGRPP